MCRKGVKRTPLPAVKGKRYGHFKFISKYWEVVKIFRVYFPETVRKPMLISLLFKRGVSGFKVIHLAEKGKQECSNDPKPLFLLD